ncbi:MAG: non-homologous end-joining DNA ligase [Hyphomicrobium sp.]|nr:non-homologous end-joining DNA ligase [Hyphomicrobium sp.]
MTARKRSPPQIAMPPFIAPCLATLATEPPMGSEWVHEIKYDGYRLQARIEAGDVRLLTRSGLDWTGKFGALAKRIGNIKVASAILDGEVVVENEHGASSFADLVADLKAGQSERMLFIAFDLLFHDGLDLRQMPLAERKAALKRVLARHKKLGGLRYSDHVLGHGDKMLTEACKLGLEGIISKRLDKPYLSGRGTIWLKSKCIATDEFVVIGYLDSKPVKNAIGALVLGYYDDKQLVYAGRVGTGFDRKTASALWQTFQRLRTDKSPLASPLDAQQAKDVVWVRPRLVAQIEYRSWTRDGILRHAAFKALRDDKSAKNVTHPGTTQRMR